MSHPAPEFEDRLDAATSRRLSRLRSMPVETPTVQGVLGDEFATSAHGGAYRLFHSVRAMAASVAVLFVLAGVLLYTTTSPVSASPQTMAQLHADLVAGRTPVMQVDSIAAANRELSSQWPESPGVPGVPEEHVMACCMKSVRHKRVACVLLKNESAPVTMMVANAADMKPATSATVTRDGRTYYAHSSGALNMISTVRDGRYVCLIGALPNDRLIDLASQLRF